MNGLGIFVLAAAVRGTALVLIGLGLGRVLRRRGPAASATLGAAMLVGMVGIAAMGASPWPRWTIPTIGDPGPARPSAEVGPAGTTGSATATPTEVAGPTARPEAVAGPEAAGVVAALRALGRALMNPAVVEGREGWRWPAWLALAAMIGVAIGLGRLAMGLAAVAALRRGCRAIDDPDLLELASVLRQRMGVAREVGLRVAPGLTMPATVGWRPPLILLPDDWSDWDERERRVVLSHELAHIRRGDYLAGVGAQLSLALQFYHPVAHWLAHRLRLDQELAADAWGAQLSGGNRPYLVTLARMALRDEPRPVGWAARTFSPARGTFLRRIEMLRDAHDLAPSPLSRRSRAVALGGLFLVGLALAGLRGPGPIAEALAIGLPPAPQDDEPVSLDRGFIPADAGMVAVIRPAELLAKPELKEIIGSIGLRDGLQRGLGLAPEDIAQLTAVWLQGQAGSNRARPMLEPAGLILRTTRPNVGKALAEVQPGVARDEVRFGEITYTRLGQGDVRECYARPDDRTLIYAEEPNMLRLLAARPGAADRAPWAEAWKAVRKGQVGLALDPSWLLIKIQPALAGRPAGAPSPFDTFEPLLSKAHGYAVGLDLSNGVRIDGIASCNSDPGTKQVADTIRAGLTLARNALASVRAGMNRQPQGAPATGLAPLLDLGEPLLEGAEVKADGRTIHLAASSPLNAGQFAAILTPAVQTQRAATKRVQSVNNMKQIGLAMHNYAQAHGNRFPAATLIGPDGKTPYSWRVAILPYIEQQDLYSQYKFDEPWDGPNNRKLLDKMPAMYAHPDAAQGTSTSYFMPTGPHTISSDDQGSALAEITDGTSNTIMAVEAKRDVPWMKPEDIPVPAGPEAKDKPLPKFGGFSPNGYNVLFADGAVRFIADSIDPNVLRTILSKDGGEPFSF